MDRLILTELLVPLLGETERITVLDVGARDALADPRWAMMRHMNLYGFDPDPAEVERLNSEARERGLYAWYYPCALGAVSGPATFRENNSPGAGSFYDQNRALTDRWKFECVDGQKVNARDTFYPAAEREVMTMRLQDWAALYGIPSVDFIRMNVQGAELDVLRGAGPMLDGVLGVIAEVGFVESYLGRPTFGEFDDFMRAAGFSFFDFVIYHHVGRAASPVTTQHSARLMDAKFPSRDRVFSSGQLVEALPLYLRDPMKDTHWRQTRSSLIKLACLAEAFGQVEYAFEIAAALDIDTSAAATAYRSEYGA